MLPSDFEQQSSLQTFHQTRKTRPEGMGAMPRDAAFVGVGQLRRRDGWHAAGGEGTICSFLYEDTRSPVDF